MPLLFDPITLGAVTAKNRILMAPLTRARATMDHVPTPMMIDYYRQRAGAGLIISEATGISAQGLGWPYAPGIWSEEQIDAWRSITAAVHEAGGLMFSQLWHMGRLVHPSLPGRGQPLSSSATTMPGQARTYEGKHPYAQAKAMTNDDIRDVIADLSRRTAILGDTKTGKSVRPLSVAACKVLQECTIVDELLFPATRRGVLMSGFKKLWKRISRLGGLPADIPPHVLRHSFTSLAADLGYSEPIIAALIGHKGRSTTSRYLHAADAVLLAAADAVADRSTELMGERRMPPQAMELRRANR